MKKQKYVKSHRRNSTPWDSKDNLSCTEIFIKENYKRGDEVYGANALSEKFNVSRQTICAVASGQNWK